MTKALIILLALPLICSLSCNKANEFQLLQKDLVDLRRSPAEIILKNSTADTLKISGSNFNYLPYNENVFKETIPPGKTATLILPFAYPDFVYVTEPSYLRIFGGPGQKILCDVLQFNERDVSIDYMGEYADINDYYLSYHKNFGSAVEQNRPFFVIGDTLSDFNRFPGLADEITKKSIQFIRSYKGSIPDWFKSYEESRLRYLGGFMKYNVPMTKEFYGGKPLNVSNEYYAFENGLALQPSGMALNTEYLWYTHFYFYHNVADVDSVAAFDPKLNAIDSLVGNSDVGDILKMQRLSFIAKDDESKYNAFVVTTPFNDPVKKEILDSLIKIEYRKPAIGKLVPNIDLVDNNGDSISIRDLQGKVVIINFWATWCGPCIKEFPHENALYQKWKEKGLAVVNICVDSKFGQWKAIAKQKDLRVISLFSSTEDYRLVNRLFNLNGLPKSILLDKHSVVLDNNLKRASEITDVELESYFSAGKMKE